MYISLPITGYEIEERKFYASMAGLKASEQFMKQHHETQEVRFVTPFEVCKEPDLSYAENMGRDITALMQSDVVGFCEGWQQSRGCRIEKAVADEMGIPTFEIDYRREEEQE